MVTSASNYGSSSRGAFGFGGVVDWVIQRKTALIVAFFSLYLVYFFLSNNQITFQVWSDLFKPFAFKAITLLVFISLLQHVWVGIWTIATDYLHGHLLRTVFLYVSKLSLVFYAFWAFYILFI